MPHESWTCGMPEGIVPPESGKLLFEADLQLGNIYEMGRTPYGIRLLTEINGGRVSGPEISGELMKGGLDWQLTLDNGVIEVEQVNILRTDDGVPIYFRNCGVSPNKYSKVRIAADFEASSASAYAWLNEGKFAGIRDLDIDKRTLKITLYDVTGINVPNESISITKPLGVDYQPWEAKKLTGKPGEVIYTATVGIDEAIVKVGVSKNGRRTIIPITGGTMSGRLQGVVLPGGADYQLWTDEGVILDARYTLRTEDNELIIIRNGGPIGSLIPVYETRIDGKYSWINRNIWLCSSPQLIASAVNLTIYKKE